MNRVLEWWRRRRRIAAAMAIILDAGYSISPATARRILDEAGDDQDDSPALAMFFPVTDRVEAWDVLPSRSGGRRA